jgi:hypothetical protein
MRRTTALVVLGWLALGAASVACSSSNTDVDDEDGGANSDGDGMQSTAVGPSDLCASLCGALTACDNGNAGACSSSECEAALAATGGKLRSDFADYVERCVGTRDCPSLTGGSAFETCRAEAVASLAPSATGRGFCDDLDAALIACSAQAQYPKAECLEAVKTYADSAITAAQGCVSKPCAQIASCVDGELPADLSPLPAQMTSCDPATTANECLDAATVRVCSPEARIFEDVNCQESSAELGFVSQGCSMDAEGTGCTLDSVLDEACRLGAVGVAICVEATDEQFVNIYINCFQDNDGAKAVVTCFADFVDTTAGTVDCAAAETCVQ